MNRAKVNQKLNQVTMTLIEAKQDFVLNQIQKALADADALRSYNIVVCPEGIPNPGKPTLVSYKSLGRGKMERLEFLPKHQKLASALYEILRFNGVLEKVAFVDVRGVPREQQLAALRASNPSAHIEPVVKRGLDAINGDWGEELCLTSEQMGVCYCYAWHYDDSGRKVCDIWDHST